MDTDWGILRARVEMQGFTGLDERDLRRVEPWLRFAPGVCAAWTATATVTGSAPAFAALAGLALIGAVRGRHPFDAIYNHGLRRLTDAPPIPRYAAPRRAACLVATVWLLMAAGACATGYVTLGRLLGASLTAASLVPVFTGFCIPSYVYRSTQRWRARRQARASVAVAGPAS
jgi:hypothetical protein